MSDAKWPALAIQGIFLAANISFLLSGKNNVFIIASLSVLLILVIIQTFSKNVRFLYLYPVNNSIPTPSYDTFILRGLILASVYFFYIGATESFYSFHGLEIYQILIPIDSLFIAVVILFIILFPRLWDQYLERFNRNYINNKIQKYFFVNVQGNNIQIENPQLFFDNTIDKHFEHDSFFNKQTGHWLQFIYNFRYDAAEELWDSLLQFAYKWESINVGKRIHKGTPYYFWGVTCILNNDIDKGFLLMHQGLEEDKKTHKKTSKVIE